MQRIVFQYMSGILFSVVGFFGLVALHTLLEMIGIKLAWGGDKGKLFWGMFLGVPAGSILGFVVIDKLYFKVETWDLLGMFLAFIVGVLCNFVGLYLMDRLGGGFFLAIPPLIVLACVCVINIRG